MSKAPGLLWVLLLGAAGFAAGFFGPMIFTPEANQGPLVGIFISGPAGVVLGVVLLVACRALDVSAGAQWRILGVAAVIGVLAVLIAVQPSPALRGYVMDLEIESCSRPAELEQAAAAGALVDVQVREQISVWEKRKPWNRGSLFATPGRNAPEEHSFYVASGTCDDYPAGRTIKAFEAYDLNGRIKPPEAGAPRSIEQVLGVSPLVSVPAQFEHLGLH